MTQANSENENQSAPIRSRTYDLPITSSDALPVSYRRLVGAILRLLNYIEVHGTDILHTARIEKSMCGICVIHVQNHQILQRNLISYMFELIIF